MAWCRTGDKPLSEPMMYKHDIKFAWSYGCVFNLQFQMNDIVFSSFLLLSITVKYVHVACYEHVIFDTISLRVIPIRITQLSLLPTQKPLLNYANDLRKFAGSSAVTPLTAHGKQVRASNTVFHKKKSVSVVWYWLTKFRDLIKNLTGQNAWNFFSGRTSGQIIIE